MREEVEGIKSALSQFTIVAEVNPTLFDRQLAESLRRNGGGQGS